MDLKNQGLLPEYALELFLDHNPQDPNSALRISERVEKIRSKYDTEEYKTEIPHRLKERDHFAIPRIQDHPRYGDVINSINELTRFLDAGCGCGWDLRRVIKDGLRIENAKGIDIKQLYRRINFELYRDEEIMGPVFEIGDALSTRFRSSSFDIIHSGSVIHALEKKDVALKYIKEMRRILKLNGIFFGKTLGCDSERETKRPYRVFITTLDKLDEYFGREGFKEIDIQLEDFEKKYNKPKKYPDQPSYMLHFYAMS